MSGEMQMLLDHITILKQEVKELNDSITWWSNRFKVAERDKKHISKVRDEIIEKYNELQQENEKIRMRNDMLRKDIDSFIQDNKLRLQENERLKENNQNMQEEMCKCWQRIDKAIEYIENPSHEMSVLTYQNLLSILQNGSEEK